MATTRTSFAVKVAGVWSSIFIRFRGLSCTALCIHGPYTYICMTVRGGGPNSVFILVVLVCCFLQGGPKVGIQQLTIYCIPTFGPSCITTLLQLCTLCKVEREVIVSEEVTMIRPRKAVLRRVTVGTKKIRFGLWDEMKRRISRIRNSNTTQIIATFSDTDRLSSSNNDTFTLSRRWFFFYLFRHLSLTLKLIVHRKL